MKLGDILNEVKVHRDDPAMDDMYDNERRKERDMNEAPYAVRWVGQGYEWYGNGDPDQGEGRYKNKFAGDVVAINVPTHEQAREIANKLDASYKDHSFYDESVYGKMGEDYWISDYYGAEVISMNDLRGYEREYAERNPRTKDFSK